MDGTGIQKRVPATADQVPHLRHAVLRLLDDHFPDADGTRQDVALAVTEACTNIVLHAYPTHPGEITLSAATDADALLVEVHDDGVGIATPSRHPGLGMGISLMHRLADTHITTHHGTTVQLRFARLAATTAG